MNILTFLFASMLGALLSASDVPSDNELHGQWGCTGNFYVFMDKKGTTPQKDKVDAHLKAMGVTPTGCVLSFKEDHRLNFRVGQKSFDLAWSIDPATHEFKTVYGGFFKLCGYIVRQGDSIVLTYPRKTLFMMMKILCTPEGRKHMQPLGCLLDCCEGLTLAMVFTPSGEQACQR